MYSQHSCVSFALSADFCHQPRERRFAGPRELYTLHTELLSKERDRDGKCRASLSLSLSLVHGSEKRFVFIYYICLKHMYVLYTHRRTVGRFAPIFTRVHARPINREARASDIFALLCFAALLSQKKRTQH